jgi:hypothetical protein
MGQGGVSGKAVLGQRLHGELAAIYLRERAASRHSHGGGQRGFVNQRRLCWNVTAARRAGCNGRWSVVGGR